MSKPGTTFDMPNYNPDPTPPGDTNQYAPAPAPYIPPPATGTSPGGADPTFQSQLSADTRSSDFSQSEREHAEWLATRGGRTESERAQDVEYYIQRIRHDRPLESGTQMISPTVVSAPPSTNFYRPTVFTPSTPATRTTPTKAPERALIVFADDTVLAKEISRLYYQQINALSLSVIERHDTIEGQNPYYRIISNLSSIKSELDPITALARQRATLRPGDFGKGLFLFEKLDTNNPYIYIDDDVNSRTYGNLIIELINLAADEEIQIQIAGNGTIYEIEEVD